MMSALARSCRFPQVVNEEILAGLQDHAEPLTPEEALFEVDEEIHDSVSRVMVQVARDPKLAASYIRPEPLVCAEVAELMAEEIGRFNQPAKSSRGGIPVSYADHLVHLHDRRTIRSVAEDEVYDLSTPRV